MGNEMTRKKSDYPQKAAILDKKRGIPPSPPPTYLPRGGSQEILEELSKKVFIDKGIEDLINQPEHYKQHGLEAIEGIKGSMSNEAFQGYLKGAALKYLWRYKYKKAPVDDLRKAKWYLDKLLEEVLLDTVKIR